MPKFPVERSDVDGMVDAINYALSGPYGQSQFFAGSSFSQPGWFTLNSRTPVVRRPFITSEAVGAQGIPSITAQTPGGDINTNALNTLVSPGLYVFGTNIAAGAQVAVTYNPATPTIVPLTLANTGPVSGTVNFYTQAAPDNLYVGPLAIATITWIDNQTRLITFAAPQPAPPFSLGNPVVVFGNSVADYNQRYLGGVVACTTTTATVVTSVLTAPTPIGVGGAVRYHSTVQPPPIGVSPTFSGFNWTDCSGLVTNTGSTDKNFINGLLEADYNYVGNVASSDLVIRTAIIRYVSSINNGTNNPDIVFSQQLIVAEQIEQITVGVGNGTISTKTNFGTVIDEPGKAGYYLYRIAIQFKVVNSGGSAYITSAVFNKRNLTAQAVKL